MAGLVNLKCLLIFCAIIFQMPARCYVTFKEKAKGICRKTHIEMSHRVHLKV